MLFSLRRWWSRSPKSATRFQALALVVIGTTLGMLLANVPVVYLGSAAAHRIPMRAARAVTALLFAAMGVSAMSGIGTL